jgi:hypothetical protein
LAFARRYTDHYTGTIVLAKGVDENPYLQCCQPET